MPKSFSAGDVIEIQTTGPNTAEIRRLRPAKLPRPKLVRSKRGMVFQGGKPISNADVARMLEESEA